MNHNSIDCAGIANVEGALLIEQQIDSGETMSYSNGPGKTKSSFDAFATVDEFVSKPVLGSDGAAS